jgi:hypothetical protein
MNTTDPTNATEPPAVGARAERPVGRPTPKRAAFEQWAERHWGSQAYRHTSATSGEWDAFQAGAEAGSNEFLALLRPYIKTADQVWRETCELAREHGLTSLPISETQAAALDQFNALRALVEQACTNAEHDSKTHNVEAKWAPATGVDAAS